MNPSDREIYLKMKASVQRIVNLIEARYGLIDDSNTLKEMKSRMKSSVKDSIEDGELVLAYEFIIRHLCDLSIPITREIYQEIDRFSLLQRIPPEEHKILLELGLVVDS